MHYYTHNIADYRADTGHLSAIEHGIYRQLLDWYYLDEQPIPKETQVVIRRLRLGSEAEAKALQNVLADFFTLQNDGYHQARCDAEIAKYHAKATKNRENGKRGGRPKQGTEPKKTQWVIPGLPIANPNETQTKGNQEPITNNQEPMDEKEKEKKEKERARPRASLSCPKPDNVSEEVWEGFAALRRAKKAPITAAAMEGIEREAAKARMSLQDALQTCCARGWAGFKAEWVSNSGSVMASSSGASTKKFDPIEYLRAKNGHTTTTIIDI